MYLAGRTIKTLDDVADDITAAGGQAETAAVDALSEDAVEAHMESIAGSSGGIDISFNALSLFQEGIQGTPLLDLGLESFSTRSHFLTARAAGRRMAVRGSGVIIMNTPTPSRSSAPLIGGMGPAWAAIEALSRDLSAELAGCGVRTVVLRSTGMPVTATIDVVYVDVVYVEDAGQREFLQTAGCTQMQGFFFHRPVPAEEIEALMIAHPAIKST